MSSQCPLLTFEFASFSLLSYWSVMELLIIFFGVDKDGRRNWYKPENCSLWWQETGLPFKSVNQTEGTLVKVHRVIRCNLEHGFHA